MPKVISWTKLVQNFRKLGFEGPHSGGKHLLFFMAFQGLFFYSSEQPSAGSHPLVISLSQSEYPSWQVKEHVPDWQVPVAF